VSQISFPEIFKEFFGFIRMEPHEAAITPSVAGLVLRAMAVARFYTKRQGDTILAVYVTDRGKEYLSLLCGQS